MAAVKESKTRLFPTHIDIPEEQRTQLVAILNQRLADCFDLQSQVKQAHWNVKGKDFYQLHLLFDEIAGLLFGYVDSLAERTTSLGGYARGTVRMASAHSELPEYPENATEGRQHVQALVERMASFGGWCRSAIDETTDLGDASTADLFTEISRGVDKYRWFLEAHLQA